MSHSSNNPDPRMLKAHAYLCEGDHEAAAGVYRGMLDENPDDPRANLAYAFLLSRQGQSDQALDYYLAAAKLSPNAQVLTALGDCLTELQLLEEAKQTYLGAVSLQPDNGTAALSLATLAEAMNDPGLALPHYLTAILDSASRPAARKHVGGFLAKLRCQEYQPAVEQLFLEVARDGHTSLQFLRNNAQLLLGLKPTIQASLASSGDEGKLIQTFLSEELFRLFLSRVDFADIRFEQILIRLRRALARYFLDPQANDNGTVTGLAVDLAQQCFHNEYAYFQSDEDMELAHGLEQQWVEAAESHQTARLPGLTACLACYRPLHRHQLAGRISAFSETDEGGPVREMVQDQILSPLEEDRIAAQIPSVGRIEQSISLAVRAQYEESPYPRWQVIGRGTPAPFDQTLRKQLPCHPIPVAAEQLAAPTVLLAGCGTGRQCILASDSLLDARITAVDLSRTSLAYAIRKCRAAGLEGTEFFQADILGLENWERRFDIIESTGVLHHMQDPMAGWRVLCNLLNPGGFMKIGLYSRLARQAITSARDYIRQTGFTPDPDGVREYRAHLLSLPESDPQREIMESSDFFTLSACRDLVFHAQEHQFTIPQIESCLRELGLEFMGFQFPQAWQLSRYMERHDGPGQLLDLADWHAFEQDNPSAFAAMYVFWCRKA